MLLEKKKAVHQPCKDDRPTRMKSREKDDETIGGSPRKVIAGSTISRGLRRRRAEVFMQEGPVRQGASLRPS